MTTTETLKLALETFQSINHEDSIFAGEYDDEIAALREALASQGEALTEQPAQQEPVAYDKTEINCFAQDLYDKKIREGKRGHYESMFHVIHQCIKKVSPPEQRTWVNATTWVGLTEEERMDVLLTLNWDKRLTHMDTARAIEAKLKEKNT